MSFTTSCLYCGKQFVAQRSTAKFCSAKCRKAHSRASHGNINVGVETSVATDAIRNLMDADKRELMKNAYYVEMMLDKMEKFERMYKEINIEV